MHELLLARAARPAPTVVLGLLLKPYSIGHYILLLRENNPLAESNQATPEQLAEAVLLCSQNWHDSARMPFDPLIGFKLWLWKLRCKSRMKMFQIELQNFIWYRDAGSLELPLSDWPRPTYESTTPRRPPGTPFLLRLHHFLVTTCHLSDETAWDHPFGLAKMRLQAHWEEQDGIDVYNHQDAERDRYIEEQEAKGKEAICPA